MKNLIELKLENHVATMTFNRPEKLNTFTREMLAQFEEFCQEIKENQTIRVILMRGEGDAFMGGSDMYELSRNLDAVTAEAPSIIRQFNGCILLLKEMEKIVISSVHGLVAGVGMSIMLASDIIVACNDTKFSLSFNQFALSPAGAVSYLLPRIVGSKKALELLVLSGFFNAHEALSYGLINFVVPHDELNLKTQQIIDRIVAGPTISITQTKQLLNSSLQNKFSAQLELEAESFVKCANTKDFKSAVRAFANHTVPEFEGK